MIRWPLVYRSFQLGRCDPPARPLGKADGILAEPIGTCILAWLILGETLSSQLALGIVLILGGLWLFFTGTKKKGN